MTQKRTSLSAGLIATKGAAAPAADAPTRAPAKPAPEPSAADNSPAGEADLVPLNFRVPEPFRRAFKIFAAEEGRSMVEIMQDAVNAYIKARKR